MSTPQQYELDPPLTHREAVRWEEGDEPDDETWRQEIREKLVTEARGEGCRPGARLVVSTIDLLGNRREVEVRELPAEGSNADST